MKSKKNKLTTSEKEQKTNPSNDKEVDLNNKKKDSNAVREGVKHRVTFLVGQSFRGVYRQKGETLDLLENDAKAYSMRSGLKIEKL